MFKKISLARAILVTVIAWSTSVGWAQEKLEGVVKNTKLTACQFKPGGCAGDLVLEVQKNGKTIEVPVKVPLGTLIKKGDEIAYLPSLRGNAVAIAHAEQNGEKVAKSIDVIKPAK
jgi:hypothetical protein